MRQLKLDVGIYEEEKRRCGGCSEIKSFDEFYKNHIYRCKDCDKIAYKKWAGKNKERQRRYNIEYGRSRRTPEQQEKYLKRKACIKERDLLAKQGKRRCSLCDKIKILDVFPSDFSGRCYYDKKSYCKKCAYETWAIPRSKTERFKRMKAVWDKTYNKKHRVKINKYNNKRYHSNIQHKFRLTLRNRLGKIIRDNNVDKTNSALELVGCDLKFLIRFLEDQFQEGMSWDNWSRDGWHLDHIIPLDAFDLTDIEEQKKALHYTNLQPLWAEENLKKGNRIDEKALDCLTRNRKYEAES